VPQSPEHIETLLDAVGELGVMSWLILFVAGLFEIAWAVGLEYSDGFSEPIPTAGTVAALVVSMVLLGKAVQDLPIGTAYAVWTGIGAVGTASLGIVLFDEPATGARLLFISVIVFGIVGLHIVSGGH
jgi:quaternary ammonium compound-resistance protein SugE